MQLPKRKGDSRIFAKKDYLITPKKYQELEKQLARLKARRPRMSQEVKILAEGGDFSENAGYQLAKGKLRGLNNRILEIEDYLKKADIIDSSSNTERVEIGHLVSLQTDKGEKQYRILGSSESDPSRNVISHLSPLGSSLLGKRKGDRVTIRDKEYLIIDIEQ